MTEVKDDYKLVLRKINSVRMKPIKLEEEADPRPVRGKELISDCYANIFLCAKKKKGKSTVIMTLIKSCVDRNTQVMLFVGTAHADPSWKAIIKWLERKKIPHLVFTSIYDGTGRKKHDILEETVGVMQTEAEQRVHDAANPPERRTRQKPVQPTEKWDDAPAPEEKAVRKPRASKKKAPAYLFVFDDLSTELKNNTALYNLLKTNRHYHARVIISSQWVNDIPPEARKQIGIWILFQSHSLKKLQEIHRDADMGIEFTEFEKIYHKATQQPFSFLYYDTVDQQFRQGFDQEIKT